MLFHTSQFFSFSERGLRKLLKSETIGSAEPFVCGKELPETSDLIE